MQTKKGKRGKASEVRRGLAQARRLREPEVKVGKGRNEEKIRGIVKKGIAGRRGRRRPVSWVR